MVGWSGMVTPGVDMVIPGAGIVIPAGEDMVIPEVGKVILVEGKENPEEGKGNHGLDILRPGKEDTLAVGRQDIPSDCWYSLFLFEHRLK